MTDDSMLSVTESAGLSRLGDLGGYVVDSLDHGDYPVAALRETVLLVELADRALALAVSQARAQNLTWQQIGDLLGVTKQAAHLRFSGRV